MYEYWYYTSQHGQDGQGMIIVSVNSGTFNTKIDFINELTAILQDAIPFKYEQTDTPYILILKSERREGVLRVRMGIKPVSFSIEDAIVQLQAKGFYAEQD